MLIFSGITESLAIWILGTFFSFLLWKDLTNGLFGKLLIDSVFALGATILIGRFFVQLGVTSGLGSWLRLFFVVAVFLYWTELLFAVSAVAWDHFVGKKSVFGEFIGIFIGIFLALVIDIPLCILITKMILGIAN